MRTMANPELQDDSIQNEQAADYHLFAQQALAYAQALKETLHQSREAQTALDRLRHTFLSTINHEMRTPLVLIFQVLEFLEDTRLGTLTDEQLDALAVLKRQVQVLSHMVESLTRVAAFLSKQEVVKPVPAQLEPVFEAVIPLAEFRARSKEVTIETQIAPNLPGLPLDVKQMTEALTQLLDNAIKFNRPGGKVILAATAEDDRVLLTVSDTGPGIEPERIKLLGQMFEQGVDPLRRAQEGLGLGLALAHYIVNAHHGEIEVRSTPGEGSTFTIKLPRA